MLPVSDERHFQQERLFRQPLNPAITGEYRGGKSKLRKTLGRPVEQGFDAEFLRESPELAGRRWPDGKIDEVGSYSPL